MREIDHFRLNYKKPSPYDYHLHRINTINDSYRVWRDYARALQRYVEKLEKVAFKK